MLYKRINKNYCIVVVSDKWIIYITYTNHLFKMCVKIKGYKHWFIYSITNRLVDSGGKPMLTVLIRMENPGLKDRGSGYSKIILLIP